MNLPNKLTVFRIVLVPIIVTFLLCDFMSNNYLYAFLLFLIAAYTDHMDGKIARKTGAITNFGKFADPLADKILVICCLICLVQANLVNIVALIIIVCREFVVTSVRLVAAEQGKVIPANNWGKLKTVSQVSAILSIIGMRAVKELISNFSGGFSLGVYDLISSIIGEILVWISVIMTIISGIIYVYENRSLIKDVG